MNSKARNTGRDSHARRKLDNAAYHEGLLIGMLLKAPEKLLEAEILEPLDLTLPRCRIALETMRDVARIRGKLTDDLLGDVVSEVAARAKCPELEVAAWFSVLREQCASTANIADFVAKVKRAALDRRIDDAMKSGDRRAVHDLVAEQDHIKERIKQPALKSRFVRLSDMGDSPPAVDWLIKGYLVRDTTAQLFGDPGSAKSFIALDMALSIATGEAWCGRKTQSGPVFYIAGEGLQGLQRRKEAWFRYHEVPDRSAPFWLSKGATALSDPGQLAALIADIDVAIADCGLPGLIVIDTIARNFGGGDENSTKDMSAFIVALDTLRERYRCCILLVHHTGHSDKTRARGSIALLGSLDAEYRIEKTGIDEKTIQMVSTRQKDNDDPPNLAWTLTRYDLPWADEDGQPLNSAVLVPNDAVPVARSVAKSGNEVLRGQHKQAFDVLQELYDRQRQNLADAGHDPKTARVSSADWCEAMQKIGGDSSNRSKLRSALVDRGYVFFEGNYVYLSEHKTGAR
jgi:hypothetical protein